MMIQNKQAIYFLASPMLLHFTLPFVMLYLIAGTIAQKYIGLYDATKLYFSNIIFWVGDTAPLPGFPVLMALIFINLTAKLCFKSPWNIKNAGNIITHIGAMLLLLGGLFTALFSTEGYLDFTKGQRKSFVSDYHIRALTLYDKNGNIIQSWPHANLQTGEILTESDNAITIEIIERCRNCKISPRANANETYRGMAQHMQITESPSRKTDEDNLAGLTLRIQNEIYTVLEDIPETPKITINNKTYRLVLERKKRQLPFSIELIEFKKENYQGTYMAKSYSSRVIIRDGDLEWESTIGMNAPLRYKGYTFFQSSFAQTPSGDLSVLAVVWNVGRAFPYISGLLMCLGMLLHLALRHKA